MTVIVTPGTSAAFLLVARQWAPDGPLQDVTGLTFTLQRTDGTVLFGPTGAITHVGTGTYSITYPAAVGLAAGDGLALWHSNQGDSVEQVVIAGPASSATGQSGRGAEVRAAR